LVENLQGLGKTILLTTHYMDEAEHLADRVMVVAQGRMVAQGTTDELREQGVAQSTIAFRLPAGTSGLPDIGTDRREVDGLTEVTTADPTRDLQRLTSWAVDQQVELASLSLNRPSLEDTYLALIEGHGGL
jgi:ABC-2 type transport system ATP-binding protein